MTYGINRVIEPKQVLPTSAWKLDNASDVGPAEMRVRIRRIHLECTNFKEICTSANNQEERIRQRIMDIVSVRGKLHNPVTDTGGLFYGVVDAIGGEYDNAKGFQEGEEVICNASSTSIPIHLERILSIDWVYGQIEVEGYGILFNRIPLIRRPEQIDIRLLLFTLNESGTLLRMGNLAVGKRRFLVVGNNLMTNLLFGFVIRKVAREDAEVVCLLDSRTEETISGPGVERLRQQVFSQVHRVDIFRPLECLEQIGGEASFDVTVNCANISGAETINILATKSGGTVIFANLINNYNLSLYLTESISRQLDLRCADGYLEAYDEFDIQLVRELAPYLEDAVIKLGQGSPVERRNLQVPEAGGKERIQMEGFVYGSRAMANVLDEILSVSRYDCNVMITGETGVGKEKVANLIHRNSSRKTQPFVKVNCASVSPTLVESEFFGYEKGAFTGASVGGKRGYFELADNSTIFLDEIGELPFEMQAKLLRVIQDGEFFRIGGTKPVKTNVRILSATNRNPEDLVEEGKFRSDLYYRLNVVRITVPPLRERPEDISALIAHFLEKYGKRFEVHRTIDQEALEYLNNCEWKGNVRELENIIQRLIIAARGESITLLDVMAQIHSEIFEVGNPALLRDLELTADAMDLTAMVDSFERNIIRHACEQYGSTRKAASAIGISQTQLVRKKKKYGI